MAFLREEKRIQDLPMSEEFRRNFEEDDLHLLNIDEEEEDENLFEDCPMPVLLCEIETSKGNRKIKVLVDSGSSLDLVSEELAKEVGNIVEERNGTKIRVANGKRCTLKECINAKIRMGPQWTEEKKAKLDWEEDKFSISPGRDADKVEVQWKKYKGQHWRRPAVKEDVIIQPGTQCVIGIEKIKELELSGEG